MKICISPEASVKAITPYLAPARDFLREKLEDGMYDDWNEAERTEKWAKKALDTADGRLLIYYLEKGGEVVASAFALCESSITRADLEKNGVTTPKQGFAHVTCIHLKRELRGKGRGREFLQKEVFADLRAQGIDKIYVKSSHPKAFALYERLGHCIAHYTEESDHGLYLRYGNIYEINR